METIEVGPSTPDRDGLVARHLRGVRTLVVDKHRLFAEVIRSVLRDVGAIVVPIAVTGREALEAARTHGPDVVLLDGGGPDRDGLSFGRRLLHETGDARLVAVAERDHPGLAAEARRFGFHGYVTRAMPLADFLTTLAAIAPAEGAGRTELVAPASGPTSNRGRRPARSRAISRSLAGRRVP